MRSTPKAAAAGLFVLMALMSASARAEPDKAACVGAHTRGQELRLSGKWLEARAQFRTCAAGSCPGPVTLDCTRWLEELRSSLPSVLLAAQAPDGHDTVDVRLLVDGAPIATALPTTALELNPGEHVVRVEHAGWPAVEQRVVLRAGEKQKAVRLVFAPERPPPLAPGSEDERPPPTFGFVMLGIGVATGAAAITFGALGRVRETDLASQPCGQNGTCSHADVDVVRRDYWIAGIVGGVSVVSLAVGLWQVLARPGQDLRGRGNP